MNEVIDLNVESIEDVMSPVPPKNDVIDLGATELDL